MKTLLIGSLIFLGASVAHAQFAPGAMCYTDAVPVEKRAQCVEAANNGIKIALLSDACLGASINNGHWFTADQVQKAYDTYGWKACTSKAGASADPDLNWEWPSAAFEKSNRESIYGPEKKTAQPVGAGGIGHEVDPYNVCLHSGLKVIAQKAAGKHLLFEVTDVYYNGENAAQGPMVLATIKDSQTKKVYLYSVDTRNKGTDCEPNSKITVNSL